MESALADEPDRESWRGEYVDWLILWGDPDEAFRQAQIGVYLHPEGSGPKAVLERATQCVHANYSSLPAPPEPNEARREPSQGGRNDQGTRRTAAQLYCAVR